VSEYVVVRVWLQMTCITPLLPTTVNTHQPTSSLPPPPLLPLIHIVVVSYLIPAPMTAAFLG